MADQPFTSWTMLATGAPTSRTLPNRLADVKNVKDYGAVGDGTANDAPAIQAIVDAHNGAIFFPPGRYKVNSEISLLNVGNSNHVFIGSGVGGGVTAAAGTEIFGNVNGWLFKHDSTTASCNGLGFKNMRITNQDGSNVTSGCIKVNFGDGFEISNCILQGFNGVDLGGTYPNGIVAGSTIQNSVIINSNGTGPTNSIGIMAGPHVGIISCSIVNFDVGIRKYSTGGVILNTRTEVNKTGLQIGSDRTGAGIGANALFVAGCTFEANLVNLEVIAGSNLTVENTFVQHGDNALATGHTIYGVKIHSVQGMTFRHIRISGGTGQTAGVWISNDLGTPTNIYFDQVLNDDGVLVKDGSWSTANMYQRDSRGLGSFATTVTLLPGNAGNNGLGTHSFPCEGDVKIVTDCNNSTAARGTTATGGGAVTCAVTYLNGNWCLT